MARRKPPRQRARFILSLLFPIALIVVVAIVAFFVLRPALPVVAPPASACPDVPDVTIGGINVPAGPVAGYCQPQLINAAQIMYASERFHAPTRAEEIGVMVAIGESGLRVLNYGDKAGPDSRGLFQQRSNYGPLAARMDPYNSAYAFFKRMFGIVNWQAMTPTQVGHRVQGNANPDYYTPYFPKAQEIVAELLSDRVPPPLTVLPPPALRG